ncbi:CHAP domain-containing protein [Micromonospora sp. WMMA1363]|uniref:C40 family peptidase n=1 Tax=Micromonospora sp. WMMA1363 TaxID=3053985 RepID=UPI00259CC053|nr:CHAP domain-containing protein [Micromonospora sp. WMMA1363]MDM4721975.1 CHAP domain-containing protein [Micromonospora sp. WMMA1363]
MIFVAALVCVASSMVVVQPPAYAVTATGPYPAKVDIDGRGSMDPNDRIKTDAYRTGDPISLRCQDTGPAVGGSATWDYTTDGYWIPDTYVKTGTDGFVSGVPRCLAIGIDGYANVGGLFGPYPAKVDIDGRGSTAVADRVRTDAYLAGSSVYLKCQDYGESAGGSTLWDYTTGGYWVPDAYLTTGTDGRIPGVPSCSSIGIAGGGANPGGGQQFLAKTTLNGYHGKSLSASRIEDRYADGSYITVMCQAYGETNYGGSAIWDYTSDGLWVADYYVKTGSSTIVTNRCDGDGPSSGGEGRYLAKTTLNGYDGKSLSASRIEDRYAGGSYITIVCQAYGEYHYGGSAVWDYTSDGLWVADYYVQTGYTDIILKRCDTDPKPSGGPGNPSAPSAPGTGSVATTKIRDAIVQAATSQIGVHEWGDNCNPYGLSGVKCGDPWCSMFASWAWRQAGINVYLPYSGDFYWWGKQHGTLRSKTNIRPGDLVLFGSGPGASNHVGVVSYVLDDGRIVTIEGNWGNEVSVVGPWNPVSPGPTHENVFAVVAPVNDDAMAHTSDATADNPVQLASFKLDATRDCLLQTFRAEPTVNDLHMGYIDYRFEICRGREPILWSAEVKNEVTSGLGKIMGHEIDNTSIVRTQVRGDGNTWSSAGYLGKFDIVFSAPVFAAWDWLEWSRVPVNIQFYAVIGPDPV